MPDPDLLTAARDSIETARERTDGELDDRLASIADRLESAVDAGRTLDHGTLARLQNALSEIEAEIDDGDEIATARDRLSTYREDVAGV
ncbi:hypothetical protein ACFQAS_01095 [Halopenitus salinus]|uniref:Uncharacterized protein n=1 Tax=Halopenitus salinus TaxID=1198295 RepID=A0ABD5V1F4_9EURY